MSLSTTIKSPRVSDAPPPAPAILPAGRWKFLSPRIELKDWSEWYGDEPGFLRETAWDFTRATNGLTSGNGIDKLRYVFRSPGPGRGVEEIRSWLLERLIQLTDEVPGVKPEQRSNILRAFRAHTDIVTMPVMQRAAGELPVEVDPTYAVPTLSHLPDRDPPRLRLPVRLPDDSAPYEGPDW